MLCIQSTLQDICSTLGLADTSNIQIPSCAAVAELLKKTSALDDMEVLDTATKMTLDPLSSSITIHELPGSMQDPTDRVDLGEPTVDEIPKQSTEYYSTNLRKPQEPEKEKETSPHLSNPDESVYPTGLRLHLIVFASCLSVFSVSLVSSHMLDPRIVALN
jgi:hypothetical protein